MLSDSSLCNHNWVIIPDIHGRSFWKEAVKGHENDNIVFLGDYLDPYSFEGITPSQAQKGLEEIIEFKKAHLDNVVLLLGNHDLGYIDEEVCSCRHDFQGEERNRHLLLDNIDLFEIVHEARIKEQSVLFSHAGLRESWVKANEWLFSEIEFTPSILNSMLHNPSERKDLMSALSQVSLYRGGFDSVGSPVWADVNEFIDYGDFLPGYLHVFGHTLHKGDPVIIKSEKGNGWCMDCAEGFLMDQSGMMHSLDDEPVKI